MVPVKARLLRGSRFCTLAMAGIALLGCANREHPLIAPAVRETLRTAKPFDTPAMITKPPVEPQQVPADAAADVMKRAKQVTEPGPEMPTLSLTLADVRKIALENNLDLQVQLYDPAIAQAGYQAERSKFEAVLEASVTNLTQKDATNAPLKTFSLTPTVVIPTQAGGTATLALPFTRLDNKQPIPGVEPPAVPGLTQTQNAEIGLSQPLFRGAGLSNAYATINIAGLLMRQTDARTKLAAVRVLANAEQFYWLHYAAHENLKIQIEQYELALEQVRTAQRMVEEGARTKIEITRAQSDATRRFERIIIAENTRRRTELALKHILNSPTLPLESATLLIPTTLPSPQGLTFNREAVNNLARANRTELVQSEIQMALDRISLNLSRNRELPDIRLNFNYAFSGVGSSFEKSIERLFDRNNDNYTLGFSASVPLGGNDRARYEATQNALSLSKTEANRKALELSIHEEVLNAINAVELNWQRILSNQSAVARTQETYEDNRLEFQLGKITSTELLLTLDQLAEARSALVLSLTEYQNSLVDLAFATGTVLGQGGVIWSPRN